MAGRARTCPGASSRFDNRSVERHQENTQRRLSFNTSLPGDQASSARGSHYREFGYRGPPADPHENELLQQEFSRIHQLYEQDKPKKSRCGCASKNSSRPRGGSQASRYADPMTSAGPHQSIYTASRVTVSPAPEEQIPCSSRSWRGEQTFDRLISVSQQRRGGERGEPSVEVETTTRQGRQVSFDVPKSTAKKEGKREVLSVLKKFDRDASVELKKRREQATQRGMQVLHETGGYEATRVRAIGRSPPRPSLSAKSFASVREIERLLRDWPDTELVTAVDHLAQAEAVVVYDGAVRAAEEAAAHAAPEYAEEAAAAGARSYRAEITHSAQEILSGERPIEILSYIGITKPIAG